MRDIVCDGVYFDPEATLCCGQVFRFRPHGGGWLVYSGERACCLFSEGGRTHILAEEQDAGYFENYFDLGRDYAPVVSAALESGMPFIAEAAQEGRGIRILRQQPEEAVFSFIISQNNNIPRIQGIISRICAALGQERSFMGGKYYTFPSAAVLSGRDAAFYASLGAGYRAPYIAGTAEKIARQGLAHLYPLRGKELRAELEKFDGVGPKVADCIALFGFGDTGAFPVDTWIEKAYREDLGGAPADRESISAYFTRRFGEYSGFIQQYLFYRKRGHRRE